MKTQDYSVSNGDGKQVKKIIDHFSIVPDDVKPPSIAYRYCPPEEQMMVQSKSTTQRIMFHGDIEFTRDEYEAITNFNDYLEENDLEVDSEFNDPEILRFLQTGKFDFKSTFENIKKYVSWRIEHVPPKLSSLWEQLINSGFMYVHGRDKFFRPMVILNPTALLPFKKMGFDLIGDEIIKWSIFIIEYVINNLFLPGKIENYSIIVDVNKLGVTEIPKSTLGKIIDCLSKGYRYRSKRMYVLNTTFSIKLAWKVIESFMSVNMKNKMVMTDKNTDKELLEAFHPSQLEEKFGGNAPNCTKFWPPWVPSDEFGHDEKYLEPQINTKSDYQQEFRNRWSRDVTYKEMSEMEINSSKWLENDESSEFSGDHTTEMRRTREQSVLMTQSENNWFENIHSK